LPPPRRPRRHGTHMVAGAGRCSSKPLVTRPWISRTIGYRPAVETVAREVAPGSVRHGGPHAYETGCRCRICVESWNARHRAARARRAAARPEANPALAHGTRSTYVNHGCRCDPASRRSAVRTRAGHREPGPRDPAPRVAGPDRAIGRAVHQLVVRRGAHRARPRWLTARSACVVRDPHRVEARRRRRLATPPPRWRDPGCAKPRTALDAVLEAPTHCPRWGPFIGDQWGPRNGGGESIQSSAGAGGDLRALRLGESIHRVGGAEEDVLAAQPLVVGVSRSCFRWIGLDGREERTERDQRQDD
jgi:hypothetical protein